jgi:predicted DsbA family dithiol-disulfide isomerase
MSAPAQIKIDIVSDVVCPWCAIGYAQLERAVGMMQDRAEFSVRWHPFELAPGMPPEGQNIADYMRERYGASPEQGSSNRARIIDAGAALGIDFRYSADSRMYNTRRAHQLIAWAGEQGRQTAMKQAMFNAFFTDQRNISDTDVLLDTAEGAGFDRDQARIALEDPALVQQVETELAHWRDQNIDGVPAFIVNGKYMIPGAQDPATFVQVLDRVIAKEASEMAETVG